jgi:prepilin-type N-terminal cleavage/methylation domain-containing protein
LEKFIYHHHNTNGVTLIELAVVLLILSIILVLSAVGSEFTGTERVGSASKELLSDLQLLRQSAMTQGPDAAAPQLRGFGIRVESTRRYRLFRFNDSNSNFIYDGTGEETPLSAGETAPVQRDISGTLELKIKRNAGLVDPIDDVLIFDHFGIPRRSNMGFRKISFVIQNPNMNEVEKKCVSLSLSRIREGIWDGRECKEQ